MSLRALAKAVHHDPSYLSKALRGLKPCGPRLARDIDNALAADGEIIAAASRRERPAPQEAPVAPEVVDYFRAQLAGHYTVDMYLGPRHLIPTVQAQAMPETARRDNAVFRARQSAALAQVPDPDRAVWAASEAASAVRATGSARLVRELKAIPKQASSWANTTAGRELREIVAAVG